jgi:hypothetical protein
MTRSIRFAKGSRFRNAVSLGFVLAALTACQKGPPAAAPTPASTAPASAATAELPGATPASATDAQAQARASVFVVHTVSDIEGFKKYFEGGAADRGKAGVIGYLLTKLDDGRYVVHFVAESVEKVEQALKSEDMQSYLSRDGAPDASLVWVTRDEVLKLPPDPPAIATYSLFLKVHVTNFDELERGFEERAPLFRGQDIVARGLHRSTQRDDVAVLHFVSTSKPKLEQLTKHPEFLDLLAKAGNRDVVKPLIGLDVARSR